MIWSNDGQDEVKLVETVNADGMTAYMEEPVVARHHKRVYCVHLFNISAHDANREFEVWLNDDRSVSVEVYEPRTLRHLRNYDNVGMHTIERLSKLTRR